MCQQQWIKVFWDVMLHYWVSSSWHLKLWWCVLLQDQVVFLDPFDSEDEGTRPLKYHPITQGRIQENMNPWQHCSEKIESHIANH